MRNTYSMTAERKQKIHNRISEAIRNQRNYSYDELGIHLGVSRKAIEKWVSPQMDTVPDTATIEVLAELLDLCPEYLSGMTDIKWQRQISESSDEKDNVSRFLHDLNKPNLYMKHSEWEKKKQRDEKKKQNQEFFQVLGNEIKKKYRFLDTWNVRYDSEPSIWDKISSEIQSDESTENQQIGDRHL